MGVSNSKSEACEALRLCKQRKKLIKQAIDSRYNLAAAHLVYIQSLQNLGIALRNFAQSQSDASLHSHSPPSPPQTATAGSGGGQSDHYPLPHSPSNPTLNYMKSSGVSTVTINLNPSTIGDNSNQVYVDDLESSPLTMSPPQPPPPPPRFSWDYFDPTEGSFRFMGQARFNETNSNQHLTDFGPESIKKDQNLQQGDNVVADEAIGVVLLCKNDQTEQHDSKNGCLTEEETEGLVIHGAKDKDFLSSIKDIENHFIRAAKSGNQVSRMLEANKIQISYPDVKGSATGSSMLPLTCFRGETTLVLHEPPQTRKFIAWKRTSSHSSSAHPPGTPSNDDDENNFVEELCMIAGSHSSTLDRLYAWERKLYDEVKASESIRKEYAKKCDQVRHQFVKDLKPHVIDKTRAVAKDLHSRMRVALHSVNSISKRIEIIRDEELQPQLVELIQGLTRMWKTMLECHHAQYITVSLAYHSRISRTGTHHNETKNQIMTELQHEVECFVLSFTDLVKCYASYIESINSWLQNCITQPKERVKGRRAFSPRRAIAPPIFVLCRDWTAGIQTLPSQKLSDAIKDLLSHLRRLSFENKQTSIENGEETMNEDDATTAWDLSMVHMSLTKVLDRLTKFSEASLKMYEDTKQNSETAENVYSNYRPPPRAYSI